MSASRIQLYIIWYKYIQNFIHTVRVFWSLRASNAHGGSSAQHFETPGRFLPQMLHLFYADKESLELKLYKNNFILFELFCIFNKNLFKKWFFYLHTIIMCMYFKFVLHGLVTYFAFNYKVSTGSSINDVVKF